MGHEELVNSLWREADDQVKAVWDEAEKKAAKVREDARRESDRIREEYEARRAEKIKVQDDAILKEAEDRARGIELSSEKALADRLFSLGLSCLGELREKGGRELFLSLYNELPDVRWELAEVNPEDLEYASELFGDAEVRADGNIYGGIRVTGGSGKICITNTLEKRLERSWDDMLPALMEDVGKEIS